MKWFRPILAASCVLVLALSIALPGWSSRVPDTPEPDTAVGCIHEPAWFAPIHHAYRCNPKITPDFDFASLYAAPTT